MMSKKLKVVELFAGVGGFRIGLEGFKKKSALSNYKKEINSNYEIVWSNQCEPSTKRQHASEVYVHRFGEKGHSDLNIEEVIEKYFDRIPPHDLLVGGFPCQDYSVATTLKNSKGLKGKKGVLWWSIYNILKLKGDEKPKYLFLENVDRLLTSPVKQRGRDFAVILSCLYEQGYAVEWRVINAADYSMPQKRKRVYILAYREGTAIYNRLKDASPEDWILKEGVHASSFPVTKDYLVINKGNISNDPKEVSDNFHLDKKKSPFSNSGVFINGEFTSIKTTPIQSKIFPLKKVLLTELKEIPSEYFISKDAPLKKEIIRNQLDSDSITIKTEFDMWNYLKGRKKEDRKNKLQGFKYKYSEGQMTFPDDIEKPSRTIITGEGGRSPSRFKHIIKQNIDSKEFYRRLTPIELERLNMFPDNHTKFEDISDTKRAFFMGNALVIGVVERIGNELYAQINNGQKK